jgi:hypothetical protein
MGAWAETDRAALYRVALRCPVCGRPMMTAERVRDDPDAPWHFPEAIQPRGGRWLPSLLTGPDWTGRHWAMRCQRKLHSRPCPGSISVRPDRLHRALNRAQQYGRRDLRAGRDF